jgi:hypothetical protein
VLPDTDEDHLGNIIGVGGVPQHFGDGADNRVLVALDKLPERSVIALCDAHHQGVVDLTVIRCG